MQRLETSELVKLLEEEKHKLRAATELAREQGDHARDVHSAADKRKAELASMMESVGDMGAGREGRDVARQDRFD